MRHAAEDRHVVSEGGQRLKWFGQLIIRATSSGKPGPALLRVRGTRVVRLFVLVFLVGRFRIGNRDPVAEKEGTKPLRPLSRLLGFRHRFQPAQRQRQTGATEKCASIEMPGAAGHGWAPS